MPKGDKDDEMKTDQVRIKNITKIDTIYKERRKEALRDLNDEARKEEESKQRQKHIKE